MPQLIDQPLNFVEANGLSLAYRRMGSGPALILLHGFPQNHLCWEAVAPEFTKYFDVIMPDLRGYGASEAPFDSSDDHSVYAKQTMANDIVGLMDSLQIPSAHVLGHDRGGRVAYRLALDHPDRVNKLGIIEIVPTGDFWAFWNANLGMKAYHWTFLAQPYPLPETMINADPEGYIKWTLQSWTLGKNLSVFSAKALESYLKQSQDPSRIHAMCADYRAGASFDRKLDDLDRSHGKKIQSPMKFLWAEDGFPAQTGNPTDLWTPWVDNLQDASCKSGHFVMEENPQAVIKSYLPFFQD